MDWSNELYVKLYRRETDDDLLLSWDARALWHEMLKRFDRSGLLTTRRGVLGLAALVRGDVAVIEHAIAELEQDGRVRRVDAGWLAPNFVPAQDARKNDRLRQQEAREKRRREAINSIEPHNDVTGRDESSHDVTRGHEPSHDVTPCHSEIRSEEKRRSETSAPTRAIPSDLSEMRLEPLTWNPNRFLGFVGETKVGLFERNTLGELVEVKP